MIQSALLSRITRIRYGFGDRDSPFPRELESTWTEYKPDWKQVHGSAGVEVSKPKQACGEVDALWTRAPGLPIAVVTADCMPILLARQDGGAIAVIHAGWRGLYADIVGETWKNLSASGEQPQEWVAVIGPSIRQCCYQVGSELVDKFSLKYPFLDFARMANADRHLDLVYIQSELLRRLGFSALEVLPYCTSCALSELGHTPDPDSASARKKAEIWRFHSYRREGSGARQWSAMIIEKH